MTREFTKNPDIINHINWLYSIALKNGITDSIEDVTTLPLRSLEYQEGNAPNIRYAGPTSIHTQYVEQFLNGKWVANIFIPDKRIEYSYSLPLSVLFIRRLGVLRPKSLTSKAWLHYDPNGVLTIEGKIGLFKTTLSSVKDWNKQIVSMSLKNVLVE